MRSSLLLASLVVAALSPSHAALAADAPLSAADAALLKQQLDRLQADYAARLQALEDRLEKTESANLAQGGVGDSGASQNRFNPAISLILDGRYAGFDNDPADYELPGFALGGEAGLGEQGLAIGHTEVVVSANIDERFFGKTTLAIAEHDGATELELEEAFVQTLGLDYGLSAKIGRFYSAMGYLNEQHEHAWAFADAPLIYRGLFGNQLRDDGLQLSYIAPTDTFLQLGVEALSGRHFPGGGEQEGVGAWTLFANLGGDVGIEHSWLLGLSHWQADAIDGRTSGGHGHDGGAVETPSFNGEARISAVDIVYKWAPRGNPKERNLQLQFEYFERYEDGEVTLLNSDPLELTRYDGHQQGWYAQAVYQFMPQWQAGLRYDQLDSHNTGADTALLAEAGLDDEDHTPRRYSVMLAWLPSEFSRVRLQFNRDQSYTDTDNQVFVQYTYSLGSHGAHAF